MNSKLVFVFLFIFIVQANVLSSQDSTDLIKKIQLTINYQTEYSSDTIIFSLQNKDTSIFYCTPILTNYNRVVVVGENNEDIELFFWIHPVGDKKAGGSNSGEEVIWKLSTELIFGHISHLFKKLDKGIFKIYWKVYNTYSEPLIYYLK